MERPRPPTDCNDSCHWAGRASVRSRAPRTTRNVEWLKIAHGPLDDLGACRGEELHRHHDDVTRPVTAGLDQLLPLPAQTLCRAR